MEWMRWIVVLVLCVGIGCSLFQRITGGDDTSENATAAPADAMSPKGHGPERRPSDKGAGIAWAQGCVGSPSAAPDGSYVKIWWMRLDGMTAQGERRQLALDNYASRRVEGELLSRSPWGVSIPGSLLGHRFEEGALVLPVGSRPDCLYHPWGVALGPETWRTPLPADIVAIVAVAELQCFGDARAQIGADYWTSVNSPPGTQFEAYASRWVDASAGRIVLDQ